MKINGLYGGASLREQRWTISRISKYFFHNSIYPNNYIDVYLKASLRQNDGSTSKVTFGKLLENVKVLAVRDSNGKNVFANVDENSVPSQLIFAVPQEYYLLLKKAEYLGSFNTELLPVPTAESLKSNPGDLKLTSDSLKQFINDNTVYAQQYINKKNKE